MSDVYQKDPLPNNQGTGFTANLKLSLLQNYTPNRIRDTWVSMGSQNLDYYGKIVNRGSVFKLANTSGNTVPLVGFIFFCNEDIQLPTSFNWSNMQINLNSEGIPDGTIYDTSSNIIHPNIFWVLDSNSFNAISIFFDPTFIPFSDVAQGVGVTANASVIIPQEELNLLLLELGVPFIHIDELEYNQDQILDTMVLPAMKEYFKWFPITVRQVYPLTNTFFNVPIPQNAFGVSSAYVNPTYLNNASASNPFTYFNELAYGGYPGAQAPTANINSRRRRGFPDTQAMSTIILERAARAGVTNYAKRQRVAVHIQQGCITGYSNQVGALEVTWNYSSNQWGDIPYARQTEVRKLAKAYILRGFGLLRLQGNSDVAGTLKYQEFLTRADKLEEEAMTFFKENTKASIVRV